MDQRGIHSAHPIRVCSTLLTVFCFLTITQLAGAQPNTPLFLPAVTYPSGGVGPYSAVVADLNGDHKLDIVTANFQSGSIGVSLGRGDGTFQTVVSYASGSTCASTVAVADVNGDGNPDLITGNPGNSTIGVLLGNGNGTFQPVVNYYAGGSFPESLAIVDVNGDGKPDLVVLDCGMFTGCGGGGNGAAAILLGNGDGTFRPAASYDAGAGAYSLAVADVNGDGKPDLAVADCGANIFCPTSVPGFLSILLGNGDGTFQPAVAYDAGGRSTMAVAVADVNSDGELDLIAANMMSQTVSVLFGNGNGTFRSPVTYGSGGPNPTAITVADVNGDGKPDVLVANYGSDTVGVLLGNGDGTFKTATAYGSGGHGIMSVTVADVNGDGKPDVIAANTYDNDVGVLLNHPGAIDTTPPIITMSVSTRVLSPATGRMVPVTIFGTITDPGSGIKPGSAEFAVSDEYQRVQPHGKITLDSAGHYSFTIQLQASREQADLDGRAYMIRVSARNNAGLWTGKWARVRVPHGD